MIFVTVGAQMPFDRMTQAVDRWCGRTGRRDVFMQIGETSWVPSHVPFATGLTPAEFRARVMACRVMVAHAGMGSILTAMETGKPILVMPRRADRRETRNDHQVGTAARFASLGKVTVAEDEWALESALDRIETIVAGGTISPWASPELLATIRGFLQERDRA